MARDRKVFHCSAYKGARDPQQDPNTHRCTPVLPEHIQRGPTPSHAAEGSSLLDEKAQGLVPLNGGLHGLSGRPPEGGGSRLSWAQQYAQTPARPLKELTGSRSRPWQGQGLALF